MKFKIKKLNYGCRYKYWEIHVLYRVPDTSSCIKKPYIEVNFYDNEYIKDIFVNMYHKKDNYIKQNVMKDNVKRIINDNCPEFYEILNQICETFNLKYKDYYLNVF